MARKKDKNCQYILQAFSLGLLAFILSFALNASFEELAQGISLYLSIPLFLFVITLGIVADGIGIASARADEKALLSMASRKVKGARESLWFVRNAPKVSSVFNDVLGDVSATLSGALAVAMIYRIRSVFPWWNVMWLTSLGVGLVSALGVGGKALFKPFALRYSEKLVLVLGKIRLVMLRVFRRK
jgi:CBS domain containing-hemolysin-like protein